jgi:hypothetical protein
MCRVESAYRLPLSPQRDKRSAITDLPSGISVGPHKSCNLPASLMGDWDHLGRARYRSFEESFATLTPDSSAWERHACSANSRLCRRVRLVTLCQWQKLHSSLLSCPRNTRYFVAIKMGRRQGGPSRTGARGSISKPIRDRRATRPPVHFHRNLLGRGQSAVFPRCSLDPYDSDLGASTASPARTAP